jgi:hypothetical protein
VRRSDQRDLFIASWSAPRSQDIRQLTLALKRLRLRRIKNSVIPCPRYTVESAQLTHNKENQSYIRFVAAQKGIAVSLGSVKFLSDGK